MTLDEIDTPTVKAFLRAKREGVSSRTGKPYAPDTIRLMRAALSSVMADAVEDGFIATNPCLYRGGRRRKAGTVSKADRHASIRPMSFEERDRFLAEAHKTSAGVLFELLAKGGLRPSEAYALRIDDLDLRTGAVRVERALELSTREIKSTKTAETRTVELSPELVDCLRDHVSAIREHAMRKGWGEPEWLFPSRTNTLLDHNHVAKAFKRALKKAGLPGFRPYDLRHNVRELASRGGCAHFLRRGAAGPRQTDDHARALRQVDTELRKELRGASGYRISGKTGPRVPTIFTTPEEASS